MAAGHVFHFHATKGGEVGHQGVENGQSLAGFGPAWTGSHRDLNSAQDVPGISGEAVTEHKSKTSKASSYLTNCSQPVRLIDQHVDLAFDAGQPVTLPKPLRKQI